MRSFAFIQGMLSCCLKPLVAEPAQDNDDRSAVSSSASGTRKEARPSNAGSFQKEPRPKVWKNSLGVVEDRHHPAHVGDVAAAQQQQRKPKVYDDESAAFDLQQQQCRQLSTGEGQNGK